VKLGPSVPAVKIAIATSGKGRVKFGALNVGDIEVPGDRIEIEIGITLAPDGTPQILTAVPETILDGDVSTQAAAVLASTLPPPFNLLGAVAIAEKVEGDLDDEVNKPTVAGIREAFADPALPSRMLMMIFGAHLTYTNIRIDGDAIAFDHIAPVEPEPKPRARYRGVIGRSFQQLGPNAVRFTPSELGDTWEAGNLTKIDHVVVVMMENRSYDHVLGHRVGPSFSDGADGLTPELVAAIEAAPGGPFHVRNLRDAAFAANAVGRRTRIPIDVGHSFGDVAQQLRFTIDGPGGRKINSPRGFVENFRPRLRLQPGQLPHNMVEKDVLGFYDERDLPFFAYLAEHYAYSDRYYCSHPGPTLPNRMFSLAGDVQYDRNGFPILENNDSDNFLLSRAPTIFDLMLRRGLGFRVYESQPSVTMLRMFARYATDSTNIVPRQRLTADAANGRLPALSWVEPQLHAHPQDDDHPPADMHRGQIFLRDVYKDLTANPAVWARTLLIITYDEHGGLYDHRVPPIAELIIPPELTTTPTGPGPIFSRSRTVSRALPSGIAGRPLGGSGTAPATQSQPLAIRYGVRVPTFVVSPWTARGRGPAVTLDHCSILKTVLARFIGTERPFLSDRVDASHSFNAFLSEPAPRLDVPAFDDAPLPPLPPDARRTPSTTTRIVTQPLSRRRMREGPVDWHELTGRWARQLGR
jgi:phospholipase C